MKVNFENKNNSIEIGRLVVGDTFIADRKSHPNEIALYMKIDGASGLVRYRSCKNYAVNLVSGQLREFNADTFVEWASAEVIFSE